MIAKNNMKKFHKFFSLLLVNLFIVSGCSSFAKFHTIASKDIIFSTYIKRTDDNEHILFGYPGNEKIILYRKGYVVGYNSDKKIADWVSYHFTNAYCVKNIGRTEDFRPDPDLPSGQRAELEDYRRSNYDKGHLAPAADMARDPQTISESFLLSNVAPQIGISFNRGIWKKLEKKIREWVRQRKNMYIFTGPIYSDPDYKTIGPNKIGIPTYFYKIIVSCTETGKNLDTIAFILPNKKTLNYRLSRFITSIDEIEKLTNLDFLHDLDDDIETELEVQKGKMW